jgi:flagellar basal body-associated protein FliL
MDKFVILLLENENTAILPNFGAIVVANETTGDLMFNEYLKFNDGKLDNIIVSNSNMELQEAQNYIAKHIREIQAEIDKGNEYSIFGLGSFSKDKDGSILFKGKLSQNPDQKTETESSTVAGPSPTPPKKEDKVTPEVKPKETSEKKVEKSVKEDEPKAKDNDEQKNVVKKPAPEKKHPKKENKYIDAKEKAKTEEKAQPKRKKSPLFFILIFLLLLVAAGSTYIGLNYDEFKAMMGWDKFEEVKDPETILADADNNEESELNVINEEEVQEDLIESDSSNNEEMDSLETTAEEIEEDLIEEASTSKENNTADNEVETVEETQPSSTPLAASNISGDFHIIAGTFTEQSNAEGLVSELKTMGYPAEIIGFLNNMHYVSVQSFESQSDAYNALSQIHNNVPRAWIYKKP